MRSSSTRGLAAALAFVLGVSAAPVAHAADTSIDSWGKVLRYASCALAIATVPESGGATLAAAVLSCGQLLLEESA